MMMQQDLKILKEHEEKLREYKRKEEEKIKEERSYKKLAYNIKNPFKGI
jgi:nitrogen-specific signal transduction histidine kinase